MTEEQILTWDEWFQLASNPLDESTAQKLQTYLQLHRPGTPEIYALFQLHHQPTHSLWHTLFQTALQQYALADEQTPGQISAETAAYLQQQAAQFPHDALVVDALIELLLGCKKCPMSFNEFVLHQLEDLLVAKGQLTEKDVQRIQQVIKSESGASRTRIDRREAEFLLSLNRRTSADVHHESWQKLFVDALVRHLLLDPQSPGTISVAEGNWLADQLADDDLTQPSVKMLLRDLQNKSLSIEGRLQKMLENG